MSAVVSSSERLTEAEETEALRTKTEVVVERLRRIVREYSPAALATALGPESMVLIDLIARERLPIVIFTIDTGRLPAETYELLARTSQRYAETGLRIEVYFPRQEAVEEYVNAHGINAFYDSVALRRRCCEIRKVEPLRRALAGRRAWITGLRADQTETRSNLNVQAFDSIHGIEKFNPLIDWSAEEVWSYLRLHQVPYNRLHDQFYTSIGCAPCTRPVTVGEDARAGRWWWEQEQSKECGLHLGRSPERRSA